VLTKRGLVVVKGVNIKVGTSRLGPHAPPCAAMRPPKQTARMP
jgi:hypothetical protein